MQSPVSAGLKGMGRVEGVNDMDDGEVRECGMDVSFDGVLDQVHDLGSGRHHPAIVNGCEVQLLLRLLHGTHQF
ncbi:hypothetical protein [Polaromonas sp.]|uniref:hypothetical protein n=1 Tax=Polaromonas sp. TaxID=1869339 RepID=UPI00286CFEBB|nr:hypothetical protein [Polaromonas sp.]